jgi:hypothetical protein
MVSEKYYVPLGCFERRSKGCFVSQQEESLFFFNTGTCTTISFQYEPRVNIFAQAKV